MSTQSMISFEEFTDFTGEDIKAVLLDVPGGQTVIGYIETIKHGKHAAYVAKDTAGKQIYAHNYSLKQVKKQFQRHEEEFRQRVQFQKQYLAEHIQSFEQLVAQYAQEKEQQKRANDLKKIRSAKRKVPALCR